MRWEVLCETDTLLSVKHARRTVAVDRQLIDRRRIKLTIELKRETHLMPFFFFFPRAFFPLHRAHGIYRCPLQSCIFSSSRSALVVPLSASLIIYRSTRSLHFDVPSSDRIRSERSEVKRHTQPAWSIKFNRKLFFPRRYMPAQTNCVSPTHAGPGYTGCYKAGMHDSLFGTSRTNRARIRSWWRRNDNIFTNTHAGAVNARAFICNLTETIIIIARVVYAIRII